MRGAICKFIDSATSFKACCEAGDGLAAIEKARERAPALVILDLSMPAMKGVEAASSLRHVVPSVKIIGYTTFGTEFSGPLRAAGGFDMVLSKQDGLEKLAEAINNLLPASAIE